MDIVEEFKRLRFLPEHHLGLGDIRITIGQQEEICAEIERLRSLEKQRIFANEELCKEIERLRAELHNATDAAAKVFAENERLRNNLVAIEDEKNTYLDYVGDALSQDDDETLWDAAQRVLSERDALKADAERYRWLRRHYIRSDPDMSGNHYWMAIGRTIGRGKTVEEAIDAALRGEGEKK